MLREYASTFGANATVFAVNTVASIVLARILGPTALGEYALVAATYTTLVNVASLGLNVSNSTLAANDRESLHALATHSLVLALVVGLLPILVYLAARPWLDATLFAATPPGLLLIGLATVPCALFAAYWGALMVGLHEIALLNRLNLAGSLGTTSVQVLVVAFVRSDAYAVAATTLLGALALNLVMLALLFLRHRWRPRLSRPLLRESLSLGLRSHLGNLANYVFLRFDYYVVSAIAGPTALGQYSLATSLAEKLWMAVQPIYSVAFSRIAGGGTAEAAALATRLTRAALWLLAGLSLVLALGATLLIAPVYTERFAPALGPLYLLLPGAVCLGGGWFLSLFFASHLRQPETTTRIAWAACAAGVPLYLILASLAGVHGAALASSLTYGIAFAATLVAFVRATDQPVSRLLVPQSEDLRTLASYLRRARPGLSPST
jgi:O-antigen/teichoic acid export membrane protein